jgi:hypothetical protein
MEQPDSGFSDDETFALFAGIAVGLIPFLFWYKALLFHGKFSAPKGQRVPLYLAPLLGLLGLEFVLVHYADPVVRADGDYQWLFVVTALVWLNSVRFLSPFLGIGITGDVIERNNAAAVAALTGALAAVMIVYGGGNIGSGPTIWTTHLPAFLGTAALFGFWLILEILSRPSVAISEDRDLAAGLRLAGFLIAMGINFGFAAAGDWISVEDTVSALGRHIWPAILVLFSAVIFEINLHPTPRAPQQPVLTHGVMPFVAQMLISVISVLAIRQ